MKIYIEDIFRCCDESAHDELVRLMDIRYSKRTFDINYPFCAVVENFPPQESRRYWADVYVVGGKTVRVCSQWFESHISDSRTRFCEYIFSKHIVDEEKISLVLESPCQLLNDGSRGPVSNGRYRGNAIGNSQNLVVRNILSNLGEESFSENDWLETKAYFSNKCAYCSEKRDLLIDHAVPINKAKLGEHRIGNLVPSCESCNSKKGDRDFKEYLGGDDEKIQRIALYMDSRNYVPLGDVERIRMILELANKEYQR